MITEIFSLLSSADSAGKEIGQKFRFNLNRNRIRSISAYSSNSIFYFPTIVSDQVTPEEMGMISRVLEKSYASFVVACIGLMPFHRVSSDDQASIESYLSQFHQNLGIKSGSGAIMSKVLGLVDTLEESVQLPITESAKDRVNDKGDAVPDKCPKCGSKIGVFLKGEPVFLCCNKKCKKYFGTVPFNEAVENAAVKELQDFLMECWEKSRKNCTEYVKVIMETVSLNDMYSVDPIDPKTRLIQEQYFVNMEEIDTWGFLGEATGTMFDDDDEDLESMSDEEIIASAMASYSGSYDPDDDDDGIEDEYSELDALLENGLSQEDFVKMRAVIDQRHREWEENHPGVPYPKGRNRAYDNISEGTVKSAIDSIMFSLESVSANKILSCPSLTKLNALEAKLNKLKNKYAKYLNRYKKKYKENKKKGSNSKLSIKFNGLDISNPKAFMKQYGSYIKIINKRLKLVEKRRAELRKRKGLPDTPAKMDESAIGALNDLDLAVIDRCISAIDESILAPDDKIFTLTEARTYSQDEMNFANDVSDYYADQISDLEAEIAEYEARIKVAGNLNSKYRGELQYELQKNKRLVAEARKNGLKRKRTEQENQKLMHDIQELKKKNAELSNKLPEPSSKPDMRVGGTDVDFVYDKRKSKSGLNVAMAAKNGFSGLDTFDKEIFTNMDMKKSNEAIPTFARAKIGFIVDETEQVVTRDVLVGIKAYLHKIPAADLISDVYNCIINKRKFLKFVKFVTGEEKSLADLLFGFKELRNDALNTRGAGQWASAFKQRKRWSKMSIPYLMKEYTPNGTVVMTMNEVQFIKDEYGVDIMTPDHVNMIMDASFLLGFVIVDQANEMCYITYDGHGGNFQQYTYAMLEREQQNSDRMIRELYRSMSR